MNQLIKDIQKKILRTDLAQFKAGDTIVVNYRIIEGNKERVQPFQGIVLQRKGEAEVATFTVRKISGGIGIERVFPINSPKIESIEVKKRGKVRRAKIFYLRELKGKKAKVKELRR